MNYKQQEEKEIKIHKVIELYKKYKNEIKNIKQLLFQQVHYKDI